MRLPVVVVPALAALTMFAAGQSSQASAASERLPDRLANIAATSGPATGIFVYDMTEGRSVFRRKQNVPRILASNTKLFTTGAALVAHQPNGTFATRVLTSAPLAGGIVNGDLYLRGGGDPTFGSDTFNTRAYRSGAASVEQLALQIENSGVTSVTGRVLGDESLFDDRRGTAYSGFSLSYDIGGKLSGLAFDRGLANARGSAWQFNPPNFAATRLTAALRALGVKVKGSADEGVTPADALPLAVIESMALQRLAALTNKPSDNFLAEMLVKELAVRNHPVGTTAAGAKAAQAFASTLGSRVALVDGSGLMRSNRGSPAAVTRFLRKMALRPEGPAFTASLAEPGKWGTLRQRLRGTSAAGACQAKTGTLRDVSTLSGYCTSRGGHRFAFSFLMNAVWPASARRIQDRMVLALANSS